VCRVNLAVGDVNEVSNLMVAFAQKKVALVFGGSRGIGSAIALRLADEGFSVALTYVSHAERARDVLRSIDLNGGLAIAIRADSGNELAIRDAVSEAVAKFGPIDMVVVNAGIIRIAAPTQLKVEDLDQMLAVNVRGVFLAIQFASTYMRDGGRIVTIGSNSAVRLSSLETAAYSMTKAAVATMVQGFALELAPRQITVNNIQPGPIETDMAKASIQRWKDAVPLRRVGQSEEIAGLVAYLAREEASFVTGESLTIDGGLCL